MAFRKQIRIMNRELDDILEKREGLESMEVFVLDNSLRESTVGQLRGHTIENKWKIYNQVHFDLMSFILRPGHH